MRHDAYVGRRLRAEERRGEDIIVFYRSASVCDSISGGAVWGGLGAGGVSVVVVVENYPLSLAPIPGTSGISSPFRNSSHPDLLRVIGALTY